MSNDENTNESVTEIVENVAEDVVDAVEETVETVKETAEAGAESAGNFFSKLMDFKNSNPKVFFGAIGGVVLLLLILMMMGGGSKKNLPVAQQVNLSVGQSYTLKSVNSYDTSATVRLVSVPGSMAAYDDTEETDRVGDCKHIQQGTRVKVTQVQEAFTKARFVQVEMLEGECAGKKGWTLATNLK